MSGFPGVDHINLFFRTQHINLSDAGCRAIIESTQGASTPQAYEAHYNNCMKDKDAYVNFNNEVAVRTTLEKELAVLLEEEEKLKNVVDSIKQEVESELPAKEDHSAAIIQEEAEQKTASSVEQQTLPPDDQQPNTNTKSDALLSLKEAGVPATQDLMHLWYDDQHQLVKYETDPTEQQKIRDYIKELTNWNDNTLSNCWTGIVYNGRVHRKIQDLVEGYAKLQEDTYSLNDITEWIKLRTYVDLSFRNDVTLHPFFTRRPLQPAP